MVAFSRRCCATLFLLFVLVAAAALGGSVAMARDLLVNRPAVEWTAEVTADGIEVTVGSGAPGFLRVEAVPEGVTAEWLPQHRDPVDAGNWILVQDGSEVSLRMRPTTELEEPQEATLDFAFSREPFPEPDDTPQTARKAAPGPLETRLFPERDVDVFAVEAPGDGALIGTILDAADHAEPRLRWLNADGAEVRPDFEATISVAAGEIYYLELRGHPRLSGTHPSEAVVKLDIAFTAEPFTEPNDTPAEAIPAALGEDIALRLMPRADKDVFAFTSPGDGAFLAEFTEQGGHPEPRFR